MKFPLKIVTVLITLLLAYSCSKDDSIKQNNTVNVTISAHKTPLDASKKYIAKNVAYGEHPQQTFDIYLPANRTKNTKTLLMLHGGGWNSGDKSDMDVLVALMQLQLPHLAVVNINYRLATEGNPAYPMQINDITTVIDTLKANRNYYTIADKYGFTGASAGSHLSMLWAYAFDKHKDIEMVSSIVGPTNFTDPAYLEHKNPEVKRLLKEIYGMEELSIPLLEEVSPYHRVKLGAPPTILFYGAKDSIVPVSQGVDMKKKLDALQITNEFTLYENEGHGWENEKTVLDTWTKLKKFITTHML